MRALLTGYSGFLGRHLAKALRKQGYDLRVLMNRTTVPIREFDQQSEIVWGSIEEQETIKKAVSGVQIVVHSAWAFNAPLSQRPTINEIGTELLLRESVRTGVDFFAFISSVAVYGMDVGGNSPINEFSPLCTENERPFIYPSEKISIERFLTSYNNNNTKIGIFRPGPIFDDNKSLGKKIVRLGGRYFGIGLGNGRNYMPNIHVDDVADAVLKWLEKGQGDVIFNVTPTNCMRVVDWYINWGAVHGQPLHPVFIPIPLIRLADLAAKILKKIIKRQSKGDIEYAIACAIRNMSYTNEALKKGLGWTDKATAEYTK